MDNVNEVLEFIQRRFKDDCSWMNGNCYYFAIILKDRFPDGKLYYDVTYGHFVFQYKYSFYDWTGIIKEHGRLVEWDKFDEFDTAQKDRIIRDCIL